MTDQLIAALERMLAAAENVVDLWGLPRCNDEASAAAKAMLDQYEADAERIRALIADLRAGNLVRREDVVAHERERCARVADKYAAKIGYDGSCAATVQLHALAAAIRAGEQP